MWQASDGDLSCCDYGGAERAYRARRTLLLVVWLVFECVFAWRICIVWHVDVARPSTRTAAPAPNSFIKSERKRNAMKFLLLRAEKKRNRNTYTQEPTEKCGFIEIRFGEK